MAMTRPPLVGLFVGGRGQRLGGAAKGLLPHPDTLEPLVEHLRNQASAAWPECRVVLVGGREEYASVTLERLDDDPPDIGPLGGLRALLAEAAESGAPQCLALACDMPFVRASLLQRLLVTAPSAAAVAPKTEGRWQPLCARYGTDAARGAAERVYARGARALQAVLDELGSDCVELPMSADDMASLRDWDSPEDVARDLGNSKA